MLTWVTVEKRKWDDSVSARWRASLAEDAGGRLGWRTAAGTRRELPRRGRWDVTARDEVSAAGDAWWVVTARLDARGEIAYRVDAAVPPLLTGGLVRFCDLDLDLELDGAVIELLDVGDFRIRAAEMGYPVPVQHGALAGLSDAVRRYRAGLWPFDGSLASELRSAPAWQT